MKSKKFVLAALALLAITMVLLPLSGCKNDTVPETPKYTVSFNTNGGSTVASQTVESGQKAKEPAADPTLEGSWFLGWYSDEGLAKKFDFNTPITTATTVYAKWSYKLHIKPTTLTNYTSPHAPSTGTWTYVEFGDWPQTIKDASVNVYETKSKEMGMFTYYLGEDSNYYVKHSDNYYKVEPIVWRVLTTSYKAPEGGTVGEILLLAEKILTGGIPYYDVWDTNRTVDGATIYPNNYEHSAVRAWLNGLVYPYKGPDDNVQTDKGDYLGKGFLQTAFTESAQTLIAYTTVDNTAASTTDAGSKLPKATDYACANTTDKVFLLSEKEATTGAYLKDKGITDEDYGFAAHDASGKGSTRIRVTTDYAEATGAYLGDSSAGYGGWWWLRSPIYFNERHARGINNDGDADHDCNVKDSDGGVVPALSISL